MSFAHALSVVSWYAQIAAPYVALGALLIALIAAAVGWRAHVRVRRLRLPNSDSLEDTLGELSRRVRELGVFREELEDYLKVAEGRLRTSLRGLGVVRFNPFEGDGSGGNQSFAAAFLDERQNGIVFSAIYTRAGQTSVYGKPIEKGISSFELTGEEREAIAQAAEQVKVIPPQKK